MKLTSSVFIVSSCLDDILRLKSCTLQTALLLVSVFLFSFGVFAFRITTDEKFYLVPLTSAKEVLEIDRLNFELTVIGEAITSYAR